MNRRLVLFGVLTAVAAGVCVRLGIWQLDRLAQRRTKNAQVAARGAIAPLTLDQLRRQDTSATHWHRVTVRGIAQYDDELVQSSRSQAGVPGVYLLTPVRPLDASWGDTAVLVLRGFLYAPDGRSVDFAKAREGDTLDIEALVTAFPPRGTGNVRSPTSPRAVRLLDHDSIAVLVHRPLLPVVLLALGDTTTREVTRAARVPPPSLGEGPHQSYAFQWFGFATVFVIGFIAFARAGGRRARRAEDELTDMI
jgi:surfeit locus 1 family protein